jgi:type I restriction enzyme, S subunit
MKAVTVQLGEVCEFVYGEALKEENRRSGKIPVYGSNGVVGWHDKALTRGATIVIGRKGSIGEVNWSNGPCFPIDTTYYVEKTERPCHLRWLYYALLKLDLTLLNKSAAVPGLNRDDAYEQHILFPDVPEQERIAALLDQVDRLRRTRRYALELTDSLVPAAFLEHFGDPKRNEKRWNQINWSDVVSISSGKGFKLAEYSTSGVRLLQIANVTFGEIDWRVTAFLPVAYLDAYPELVLRPGDLVMALNRPILGNRVKFAVLDADDCPSILYQRVGKFRLNSECCIQPFLCGFMSTDYFFHELKKRLTGSDQPYINPPELDSVRIPLPPLPLQQKFAALVERAERLRAVQREALRQAEHLFASLLHLAFSGSATQNAPSHQTAGDPQKLDRSIDITAR